MIITNGWTIATQQLIQDLACPAHVLPTFGFEDPRVLVCYTILDALLAHVNDQVHAVLATIRVWCRDLNRDRETMFTLDHDSGSITVT
jgi:hypothetical protein